MSIGVLRVPSRFEAVRDAVGSSRVSQVLIEAPDDLSAVKQAVAEVESSGQGKLLFLRGESGTGKTSLAEASPVFLANVVGGILTPPPDYEVPLQELPSWLAKNLPEALAKSAEKLLIVNLDGREIPTLNEAATNAAMVNLNALLRRNSKLLVLWPVIDRQFANEAISRLQLVGSQSALTSYPVHEVQGIGKERYFDVLNLLLRATSLKLEDAAVSEDEALKLVNPSISIGDYLSRIQSLVVSRYDLGELGAKLPIVYVVFSSSNDLTPSCRLIRRGDRFLVDSDRLLQLSRANVADDWRSRGNLNPRNGLPFIVSLFEVRVLNISSSAVVNACAFSDDEELQQVVRKHYPNPVKSNAANTLRNSSLVRALQGLEDVGLTTSNSSNAIQDAYISIQALTNRKHRQINEAIIKVITQQQGVNLGSITTEYQPISDKGLTVDVWIERGNRPEALEFTHQSKASEAVLSSYLLNKIQDYARDYNLI
jgi:hypothetical protein